MASDLTSFLLFSNNNPDSQLNFFSQFNELNYGLPNTKLKKKEKEKETETEKEKEKKKKNENKEIKKEVNKEQQMKDLVKTEDERNYSKFNEQIEFYKKDFQNLKATQRKQTEYLKNMLQNQENKRQSLLNQKSDLCLELRTLNVLIRSESFQNYFKDQNLTKTETISKTRNNIEEYTTLLSQVNSLKRHKKILYKKEKGMKKEKQSLNKELIPNLEKSVYNLLVKSSDLNNLEELKRRQFKNKLFKQLQNVKKCSEQKIGWSEKYSITKSDLEKRMQNQKSKEQKLLKELSIQKQKTQKIRSLALDSSIQFEQSLHSFDAKISWLNNTKSLLLKKISSSKSSSLPLSTSSSSLSHQESNSKSLKTKTFLCNKKNFLITYDFDSLSSSLKFNLLFGNIQSNELFQIRKNKEIEKKKFLRKEIEKLKKKKLELEKQIKNFQLNHINANDQIKKISDHNKKLNTFINKLKNENLLLIKKQNQLTNLKNKISENEKQIEKFQNQTNQNNQIILKYKNEQDYVTEKLPIEQEQQIEELEQRLEELQSKESQLRKSSKKERWKVEKAIFKQRRENELLKKRKNELLLKNQNIEQQDLNNEFENKNKNDTKELINFKNITNKFLSETFEILKIPKNDENGFQVNDIEKYFNILSHSYSEKIKELKILNQKKK
ncbi:hypothetical protein M0812_24977 [Anaeramoeba flamelloides]|uniref:DUF4200 domain-containing protein n=1 Tax=Anaeramoeba flamelloides TaxID=1746091 RepID=A0AAV7YL86_9EUKA|nr:hypothetical protein M0812_24977 [Anaeramoeba flamelloides]